MASVSAADVRDALNLTPADIPDSKVLKMIKRAEVTLELELEKQIDYASCTDAEKEAIMTLAAIYAICYLSGGTAIARAPEPQNAADEKLQQYVIDSLSWKMPSLVPFTFKNASALQLAKHLLKHRTGSTATLYQYIYGVHRFRKWTNTQPDQIIKSCQDQDGDPNPKSHSQIHTPTRRLHRQPISRRISTRNRV